MIMEEIKNGHGGKRSNCGRKPKNRNNKIIIRVSDVALEILRQQKNMTDFIEALILGRPLNEEVGRDQAHT